MLKDFCWNQNWFVFHFEIEFDIIKNHLICINKALFPFSDHLILIKYSLNFSGLYCLLKTIQEDRLDSNIKALDTTALPKQSRPLSSFQTYIPKNARENID